MSAETNDELRELVHRQADFLLRRSTEIELSEVIAGVAQHLGVAPDRREIRTILDTHPRLVSAGMGSPEDRIYKRGINSGPPRRNPISGGR